MNKKFLIAAVLLSVLFAYSSAQAFWGFGRVGLYWREDASDDKEYITELRTGQGTGITSSKVLTLQLTDYDISDDPGDAYDVTSDNLTGRNIITNDGAGAKRTYNLPDCSTDTWVAYIYAEEDQSVDINPDDTDWIYDLTDATGDAIETKGLGNFIILINHDTTGWYPHSYIGTWSDID